MGTEYPSKLICPRRAAASAVAVAFALGTALVSPAGAHAAYKESSPANKSTVSSPPSSVWAEYTEPPAQSSYLRVYDPCGRRVDNGDSQATGYRVTISMSASTKGTYRVDWAVLSTFDGHHTRGSFTFTSSSGEPCPGAPEDPEDPEDPEPSEQGGGGGAGGETEAAPEAPGSADEEVAAAESKRKQKKNKKPDRPAKRSMKNKASEEPDDGGESAVFGAAPRPAAAEEERPRSGEMPLDGLAIGLLLAALIGAAGGYIYAGIMGPKR